MKLSWLYGFLLYFQEKKLYDWIYLFAMRSQKVITASMEFARKLFLEICKLSYDRQIDNLSFLISAYFFVKIFDKAIA